MSRFFKIPNPLNPLFTHSETDGQAKIMYTKLSQ